MIILLLSWIILLLSLIILLLSQTILLLSSLHGQTSQARNEVGQKKNPTQKTEKKSYLLKKICSSAASTYKSTENNQRWNENVDFHQKAYLTWIFFFFWLKKKKKTRKLIRKNFPLRHQKRILLLHTFPQNILPFQFND